MWLRDRLHGKDPEAGVTLAEVLVTMTLTAVLGTVLTSAFTTASQTYRSASEEADGQSDVRTTIERLGRDIRTARGIDAGATGSTLVLWIDENSDYRRDATEIVTWTLHPRPGTTHFDVTRLQNGKSRRQSRLIVSQLAFQYKPQASSNPADALPTPLSAADAAKVRIVQSDIQYDAVADLRDATGAVVARRGAVSSRRAQFVERLRNVS